MLRALKRLAVLLFVLIVLVAAASYLLYFRRAPLPVAPPHARVAPAISSLPVLLRDSDNDPGLADQIVSKLSQLHETAPGLAIIPAHGRSAYKKFFAGGPQTCVSGQPQ